MATEVETETGALRNSRSGRSNPRDPLDPIPTHRLHGAPLLRPSAAIPLPHLRRGRPHPEHTPPRQQSAP